MSLKASLPSAQQAVIDQGGTASRSYYVFLQAVATSIDALSSQAGDVTTTTTASPISPNANVLGAFSIFTQGTLRSGIVRVLLQGDVQTPGNTQYYGSDVAGARGWFNVSDTLDSTSDITLTVGADGVTTIGMADLADSFTGTALVKITRDSKGRVSGTHSATTSDLAEGTNLYFTNARASAAAPVQSVFGRTGTVVAATGDYTFAQLGSKPTTLSGYGITDAATSAQGAKADSAVQSVVAGTNVTVDNTDPRNPVVSASGGGAVSSVFGRTGAVAAVSGDYTAAQVGAEPTITAGTTAQYWRGDKTWRDFATDVRAAVLTGLSTATSAVIAATDTVLGALGKLQVQITDNLLPADFIEGLQPFWSSATSVGVRAGAAYIQGSGKVVRASADLTLTSLALTASAWSHLYVFASSGVLALEASATAPAAAYSGTARSKTADTSRRYVGSVLTDASGNVYKFLQSNDVVMFEASIVNAPFLVSSAGRATTVTNIACAGCVPITAKVGVIIMATVNSSADAAIGNADMSGTLSSTSYLQYVGNGIQITHLMPLDSSQRFNYIMTATTTTGGFYARVCGYFVER